MKHFATLFRQIILIIIFHALFFLFANAQDKSSVGEKLQSKRNVNAEWKPTSEQKNDFYFIERSENCSETMDNELCLNYYDFLISDSTFYYTLTPSNLNQDKRMLESKMVSSAPNESEKLSVYHNLYIDRGFRIQIIFHNAAAEIIDLLGNIVFSHLF